VIVTAGHDGRIRTFQNFGFPSITSIWGLVDTHCIAGV
jgi:hypothetical protein